MTTPERRFRSDTRPLRFPEDEAALEECFTVRETRKVSKDNVLSYEGVDYEVPRGHAGKTVEVFRRLLADRLLVLHDGRLVELHPVDLAKNAIAGRAVTSPPPDDDEGTPTTAAALAFKRDLGSVVGPDGGFPQRHPQGDKP